MMERTFTSLSRLTILVIFIIVLQVSNGFLWRRRRSSRPTPPTKQKCSNQAWSQWTQCTPFCEKNSWRKRTRKTCSSTPKVGWEKCPAYGGCLQTCDVKQNKCSCLDGFTLDTTDGKTCIDIDECKSNGGRGPCSHACKNIEGDYQCLCENGYRLSEDTQCIPRDCRLPQFSSCPSIHNKQSGQKFDGGLPICAEIKYKCQNGTEYNSQCSLSCPQSYSLALKDPSQLWSKFSAFDFNTPSYQILCHVKAGATNVLWHTQLDKYYCRRSNDPPLSISLSNTVIKEGSSPGSVVGQLSAVDEQKQQTIVYSVQPRNHTSLFRCRGSTLESSVVFKWKPNDRNSYAVIIRAQDNGSPRMWTEKLFEITVQNVNDPPRNIEISENSVPENATVGTVVGTLSAIDDDVSLSRSLNFSWKMLVNSSGNFKISGYDVIVNKSLNYDLVKEHYIKVACYDSMNEFSTSSLLIYVINSIDPPTLTLNSNKIPENSNLGTVIGQIEAKSESNQDLMFTLSFANAQAPTKFALSPLPTCLHHQNATKFNTTCVTNLTVSGHLDFEEQSDYVIQVFVKNDESSNFKRWNITVENINEKPDKLDFNGMTEIPEVTKTGQDFCFILVSDPDNRNGITQQHKCIVDNQIGDGKYFQVVMMNNNMTNALQVQINQSLNYEIQQTYNVSLKCTDNGSPPLSVMGSVLINVTDTDEPIENLTLSSNDIWENSPNNTLVGYLDAYDPDIHRSNSFTFSIVGPDHVPFRIKDNNQLVLNGSLNFEENSEFLVTVSVSNSGSSLQWPFKINVLDVNEPPTDVLLSKKSMDEGLVPGSFISNITMIDEDENTVTKCEISNHNNDKISVNETLLIAGEIAVDYELETTRFLEISLKCCDQYELCLTKNFSIEIKDINEPPTDIIVDNLYIVENQKDVIIGDIIVVDPDQDQKHFCNLSNGIEYLRTINNTKLVLMKELDYEQDSIIRFEISCREMGNFTNVITKQFELNVFDINEKPTKGCSAPIYVAPETSIGSIIADLNVTDPDNEKMFTNKDRCQNKQQLRYTIQLRDHDFPFKVINGYLVKTGVVDVNTTYNIGISVEDDGVLLRKNNRIISKTFKVNFTCTVYSIALRRSFTTLSSNRINQLSVNGTVIGYFNTTWSADVNSSSDFTDYQFVPETCNTYPFGIVGNKLTLTFSEERRTSQNDENGIPNYVIIHVKSKHNVTSDVITTRFLIMIKDDKIVQSSICYQNNKIQKNSADKSKLGPIIIRQNIKENEDKEGCKGPPRTHYMCEITPSFNESSRDFKKLNLTKKLYVDQDMFLRINTSLDYKNLKLDKLVVLVTCWDPRMPLLFIKGTLNVIIQDCPRKIVNGQEVCVRCEDKPCRRKETCTNLIPEGYTCKDICEERSKERDSSLCLKTSNCPENSLCSEMIDSSARCVPKYDQVMIGVSFLLNKTSFCYFEKCLEKIMENPEDKCLEGFSEQSTESGKRRKRETGEELSVEILHAKWSSTDKKTLLFIAIWKLSDGGYSLKDNPSVLDLLKSSNDVVFLRTDKDCVMFENSDITCPITNEKNQTSGKNTARAFQKTKLRAVVGSGAAIVLIVIIVAIFYCFKKKRNRAKQVKKSQTKTQENLGFYELDLNDMKELERKTQKARPTYHFDNGAYQEPIELQTINNEKKNEATEYSEPLAQSHSLEEPKDISNPLYGDIILIQQPKDENEVTKNVNLAESSRQRNVRESITGELLNPREKCQKSNPKNLYPYYEELPPVQQESKKSKKSINGKSENKNITEECSRDSSPYYHVLEAKRESSETDQDTDKTTSKDTPVYFVLEKNSDKQYQSLHRDLEGPLPAYATYRLPEKSGESKKSQAHNERVYQEPNE